MRTAEHMYVFEISVHTLVYLVTESWIATSTYVDQLTRENGKIKKTTVLLLRPRWPLKIKTYEKVLLCSLWKTLSKAWTQRPKKWWQALSDVLLWPVIRHGLAKLPNWSKLKIARRLFLLHWSIHKVFRIQTWSQDMHGFHWKEWAKTLKIQTLRRQQQSEQPWHSWVNWQPSFWLSKRKRNCFAKDIQVTTIHCSSTLMSARRAVPLTQCLSTNRTRQPGQGHLRL